MVKNLEIRGEFDLWGLEDPLEEEMVTQSYILAWRISCTEKPGGLQSRGSQRVRQDSATKRQHRSLITVRGCPSSVIGHCVHDK